MHILKMKITTCLLTILVAVVLGSLSNDSYAMSHESHEIISADKIETLFHRAKLSFLRQDNSGAADNVRKAADIVTAEKSKARKKKRPAFQKVEDELEALANDLEAGKVKRITRLSKSFAIAHNTLAKHHHENVVEWRAAKESAKAGHALNSATHHVAHAAGWIGHKIGSGSQQTLSDASKVSGSMIKGASVAPKAASDAIGFVGSETKKVGHKIGPKDKAARTSKKDSKKENRGEKKGDKADRLEKKGM